MDLCYKMLADNETTTRKRIVYELLRDRIDEIKVASIDVTVVDKMINALKRGGGFTFTDNRLEGVSILEVYKDLMQVSGGGK